MAEGEGEGEKYEEASDDANGGAGKLKGIAARVASLGTGFRRKHTMFADTLKLLRDMDLIDETQQQRLEGIWQTGDVAARLAVEALVGKVANFQFDKIDVGGLKKLGLSKAADALGPTFEKLRAGQLEAVFNRYADPEWVDAVLDRATAITAQTLVSLTFGGLAFLTVAVLAFVYPQIALDYGIPGLLVLVAGAMWYYAWEIKRSLKALDLDLTTLSHLHPHERRAIVISRLASKARDHDKVRKGLDWLNENLSKGETSTSGESSENRPLTR